MRSTNKVIHLADLNVQHDTKGGWTVNHGLVPYQHIPNKGKVKDIALYFDETYVVCPVVSEREDGTLVIVDGQHRVLAMLVSGVTDWACEVFTGLDLAGEALLYRRINGDRRSPSKYEMWVADRVANDKLVLACDKTLATYGLEVAAHKGVMKLASTDDVRGAFKRGNLKETLDVIKAWSFDERALEGPVMAGVSRFLRAHPTKGAALGAVNVSGIYKAAMAEKANTMLNGTHVLTAIEDIVA